jgi:hypothetical protein
MNSPESASEKEGSAGQGGPGLEPGGRPAASPDNACAATRPACPACGGPLVEQRGKLICSRCRTICETCCEGGRG